MEPFIQALIVAFREGLEAFLVVAILVQFLEKSNNKNLKKSMWAGLFSGLLVSILFGLILHVISSSIGGTGAIAKLWESVSSLIAVMLVTTFIIWMIKHGSKIKQHVENQAALNLSKKGIFLLTFIMIIREGVEISIFSFAGNYSVFPLFIGLILSALSSYMIFRSFVKVNINTIFTITLIYLILQAGFLLGYGIHEGLSATKDLGLINQENPIFTKPFDLSHTVFNHKEGIIGVPLYIAFGWYSKPEWIQFILQHIYSIGLIIYALHKKT